jgi:hypothetical protein
MAIIETLPYIVLCTYFALVGAIFSSFLYYLIYDINEYVILYHCEPKELIDEGLTQQMSWMKDL